MRRSAAPRRARSSRSSPGRRRSARRARSPRGPAATRRPGRPRPASRQIAVTIVDSIATIVDMPFGPPPRPTARPAPAIYAPYVTDTAITFETRTADGRGDGRADRDRHEATPGSCSRTTAASSATPTAAPTSRGPRTAGRARSASTSSSAGAVPAAAGRSTRRCSPAGRARLPTSIAGMTLPNEASVGLHRALGFEPVGTYRRSATSTAPGTTSPGPSASSRGGRTAQNPHKGARPLWGAGPARLSYIVAGRCARRSGCRRSD